MENNEMKQWFGAILEGFDRKFDLLIEGYATLDKKIDNVHNELNIFREEVNFKFEIVFNKLKEATGEIAQIKKRLSN